jgi:nitrate reductase NapE component
MQPSLDAKKAAQAKTAPAVSTEKSLFWKHWAKIAIGALILYPVVIVLLVGFQGSLKWVDTYGIQILIYVMLGLGPQHHRRPRRPARSRLRRLLCRRRLLHALLTTTYGWSLLDCAADRGHRGGTLGRHDQPSGAAPQGRLSSPSSLLRSRRSSASCSSTGCR